MMKTKLNSPSALLAKLKHDVESLELEVSSYGLFNIAVTGYHLLDWIKNGEAIPPKLKIAVREMYDDEYVSICRDLANSSKHFVLNPDYKNRKLESINSEQGGYGTGRFGKGVYGVGEEQITIMCIDGKEYDILEFSKELLNRWTDFFHQHSIQ